MFVSPRENNNLYALEKQQQQRIDVQTLTTPITTGLTLGTTCIPVPTSFAGTMPQLAPPIKIKRKQVKNACGK
jgi:hypothetical protein